MQALLESKVVYAVVAGIALTVAVNLHPHFTASERDASPGDAFDGTPKPGHSYFFSVGDFGVLGCQLAYEAGDLEKNGGLGNEQCYGEKQKLVAEAMAHLAGRLHPEFVLSLGDNFYVRGVRSLEDFQFNTSFEGVYNLGALAEVPWTISLGDHDQRGNVSALLLHSNRSSRWNLEAPYYGRRLPLPGSAGGPGVELLIADSVGLEGAASEELLAGRRFAEDYSAEFAGPAAGAAQWSWLEEKLGEPAGAPPALWILAAHRPVLSMVNRSRTKAEAEVEVRLRKLLRSASQRAPVLYMNGHDHAMQLLAEPSGRLHYVGNGVGGMGLHSFLSSGSPGAPSKEFVWGHSTSYGFIVHELGPSSMAMHFIDAASGRSLHSSSVGFAP